MTNTRLPFGVQATAAGCAVRKLDRVSLAGDRSAVLADELDGNPGQLRVVIRVMLQAPRRRDVLRVRVFGVAHAQLVCIEGRALEQAQMSAREQVGGPVDDRGVVKRA